MDFTLRKAYFTEWKDPLRRCYGLATIRAPTGDRIRWVTRRQAERSVEARTA